MRAILAAALASAIMAGCIGQGPADGGPDGHGCVAEEGHVWCEPEGRCVKAWEEYCAGVRHYRNSPEECATAKISCRVVEDGFSDDTGCGCKVKTRH